MKTLISWLVANIEILFEVILVVVAIYLSAHSGDADLMGVLLFLVFCISTAMLVPKNFWWCVGDWFACLIFYGMAWDSAPASFCYFSLISSLVVALVVAVYAAINMDDVVSRRMLYVNSTVSMFQMTLLYTINRFTVSAAGMSSIWFVYYLVNYAPKS